MTNLDPKHLDALTDELRHHGWEMAMRWPHCAADTITALRASNEALLRQVAVWQDAAHQKEKLYQSAIKIIARESEENESLRAQIDRERAATIEAAAKECDAQFVDIPDGFERADGYKETLVNNMTAHLCACEIRALHTASTRAAMDAIRRDGYEAGVRDARQLCAMVEQRTKPGNAHEAMIFHLGFTEGRKGCEMALAASIPPDPDTSQRK